MTNLQEDGCDKGAHQSYLGAERNTHGPIEIPNDICSNPRQDLGLIEITVLVVSCPIALTMPRTSLLLFTHQIQASGQRKTQRRVDNRSQTAGTPFVG